MEGASAIPRHPNMSLKDEQYISLNSRTHLSLPLTKDSLVILHSQELNLRPEHQVRLDNTSINFYNEEGDNLLHISFRRVRNQIVFNSRLVSSDWGQEEKVALSGIFLRDDTYIVVYDHGDRYQILIDGRTVHYFTKRKRGDGIEVGYLINDGMKYPIFSHTLVVQPVEVLA